MLWRKLLMCGSSASALSTHWILPGGRILTLADGQLVTVDPAAGWPQWTDGGDPFRDAEGRIGTYEQLNHGGGVGEVRAIRLRDSGADREQPLSLGPYRGWASENVSIGMSETGVGHPGNPFGYSRPRWQLSSTSGGSLDTGYTTDWPWEQASNGTSSGESTNPEHVQVIQAHYTPHMAYEFGVCVARDLAVVTRLEATAMNGSNDVDPVTGRRWIGWTMDAAGTPRRIRDLTAAQARQLGRDNGFVPPDDTIVASSGQLHGWEFLRPIGPVGLDAVLATGCLRYEESYTRLPTADERPFYTVGRAGYGTNHQAEPLLDGDMAWFHGNDAPITITERRACYVFCTVLIRAGGIAGVTVTGSSVARSTQVQPGYGGPFGTMTFRVFKRRSGGYDVVWQSHPQSEEFQYRGETFPTEFVTSPNGWRTAIIWPVRTTDRNADHGEILPGYMPVWFVPDDPRLGSTPPPKPADWDEDVDGEWVEPPYDVDERFAWRGMRYWRPNEREWHWQQSQNSTFADYGRSGSAAEVNPMYPTGPYARDGAGQWYGRGGWAVARHQDGSISWHAAGLIVPGIENGPAGDLKPHAEPDGSNPVMRLLQWPGRSWRLAMTQDGAWSMSRDGRAWSAIAGLGAMLGTLTVAAELADPPPGQDGG